MDYTEARALLDQKHTRTNGKGQKFRKLENNTYLVDKDGYIAVVYHTTEVVKFYPDHFVLNSGGWKTPTTKERINWAPIYLYQRDFKWYLCWNWYGGPQPHEAVGEPFPFKDGIAFPYEPGSAPLEKEAV